MIWSLGTAFLSKQPGKRIKLKSVFSPPFVAIIVSLLLILFKVNQILPQFILRPIEAIGNCTIPFALLVVGAILAEVSIDKHRLNISAFLSLGLIKLFLIPASVLLVLVFIKVEPLAGLVILLQAAAPSANSLAYIARDAKADYRFISEGIFITHIASLITIPIFIWLFSLFA